jgi:Ca2+-binding EF-hand superfamily protein
MQWFNAIDVDRDGELDAGELQRALALGNLHFSLAVVAHMIRCGNSKFVGKLRARV